MNIELTNGNSDKGIKALSELKAQFPNTYMALAARTNANDSIVKMIGENLYIMVEHRLPFSARLTQNQSGEYSLEISMLDGTRIAGSNKEDEEMAISFDATMAEVEPAMTTVNTTPLKWKEYKIFFSDGRENAKAKAEKMTVVVRSRGMWLNGADETDNSLFENVADAKAMTFKTFLADVDSLINKGAVEIGMNGGFDGAESVYELNNGNYSPWLSDWYVPVWTKAKGWLTEEEIETLLEQSE